MQRMMASWGNNRAGSGEGPVLASLGWPVQYSVQVQTLNDRCCQARACLAKRLSAVLPMKRRRKGDGSRTDDQFGAQRSRSGLSEQSPS